MVCGGVHVIIPAFKSDAVWAAIRDQGVTDLVLVPTMIQMLVDDMTDSNGDAGSLQRIFYGGSPISEGLLERVTHVLPEVRLTQVYGMTEVAPLATVLESKYHRGASLCSAGRAAPHAEIQILDDAGAVLAIGAVGEICVRGDHVMHGYWNRPGETDAVLVDGWYRTGDAGYLDAGGSLRCRSHQRHDHHGRRNVYSAEVENALGTHPSVAVSAVVGLPSDRWGEIVHAVVVAAPNARIDPAELQAHVRGRLANYKVPRSVDVVDELPLSGAGKVLKRQVRELALARTAGATTSAP